MNQKDTFSAKIMLFGEYSIILHSQALLIPYPHFYGRLRFMTDTEYSRYEAVLESNRQLSTFCKYLAQLDKEKRLLCNLNLDAFREDINNKLFFDASIPTGYGVGSSGALTAAVYARYSAAASGYTIPNQGDSSGLKKSFAQMESFFHGSSSGLDPLICYAGMPMLVKDNASIEWTGIPEFIRNGEGRFFLLDTGKPGDTGPQVNRFLRSTRNEAYLSAITDKYIPVCNACIHAFSGGQPHEFYSTMARLSEMQLEYFEGMIPGTVRPLFQGRPDSGNYLLKLCGAGGGGFMLGYTPDYRRTDSFFSGQQMKILPVEMTGITGG